MTVCETFTQISRNDFGDVQQQFFFDFRRNCYFEDERKLKYFNKYTRGDCIDECFSDTVLELCGCFPYHNARKSPKPLIFCDF